MEEIISVLRTYRELRGISYDALSRKTNIPKSTLHRYETHPTQKMDIGIILKIVSALEIPLSALYGSGAASANRPVTAAEEVYKLPVFGKICAGAEPLAEEHIIEYEYVEKNYRSDTYFYLQVQGDSMSPRLDPGDLVLVKKQETIEDGDVAILVMDGVAGMIKKIQFDSDCIRLVSFNPYYPDLQVARCASNRMHIVGKVIESKRKW